MKDYTEKKIVYDQSRSRVPILLENKGDAPISYDINRVSIRNANRSKDGPYKNSFLRQIILSHGMSSITGSKQELVERILSFQKTKSERSNRSQKD